MSSRRRRSFTRGSGGEDADALRGSSGSPLVTPLKVAGVFVSLICVLLVLTGVNNYVLPHLVAAPEGGAKSSGVRAQTREMKELQILPEQLQAMSFQNVSAIVAEMRSGKTLISPSETRLHGLVGLKDDGTPGWQPADMPPENVNMVKALRQGGGFNLRLSDALPLDRLVLDSRAPECRHIQYDLKALPKASVIIVFFNEPASTLLRSIHSVYNYSPPELLDEVLLVDDGSTLDWIRPDGTGELEQAVKRYPKMRLLRNSQRAGIVAARMNGIRNAKASIFVILDSHIEVQPQWLEPLVARISENRESVVMPQVDGLNAETFAYEGGGIGCTLGFLWKLVEHSYTPIPGVSPPERLTNKVTDPVSSPTMAGGLFAADRTFFLDDMGGYDEGFQFWGTENLELSFRLWTCGGRLECIQCSRVYHVFRKGGVGYSLPMYSVQKNKLRLMSVWMDNYADLAYKVSGEHRLDFGDVASVKNFRQQRQCKPFSWFLSEVFPESYVVSIPEDVPYLGPLRHANKCLVDNNADNPGSASILLVDCANTKFDWMYFKKPGYIMPVINDESCLSPANLTSSAWCEHQDNSITVEETSGGIVMLKRKDKCIGVNGTLMSWVPCDISNPTQFWNWSAYQPPKTWTPAPASK